MQGRQGILIADDGILVVLQAGLLWSAGGEEKEAKEGGEKSKPFCCAERQIRRFERHEGFLVYRGRMHSGGEGGRPGRDVIAERRKHVSIPGKSCRVVGFF